MSKNRFESTVERIELEDGEWIEVKTLTYGEFKSVFAGIEDLKDDPVANLDKNIDMLETVLMKWSFKDGDKEVECCRENLERLSMETLQELSKAVIQAWLPEKKSSTSSKPTSKESEPEEPKKN